MSHERKIRCRNYLILCHFADEKIGFTEKSLPTTRGGRTQSLSARRSSFTSGKTRMVHGRSRESSVTTTMLSRSEGSNAQGAGLIWRRYKRPTSVASDVKFGISNLWTPLVGCTRCCTAYVQLSPTPRRIRTYDLRTRNP